MNIKLELDLDHLKLIMALVEKSDPYRFYTDKIQNIINRQVRDQLVVQKTDSYEQFDRVEIKKQV